jgi:hypothetical protein
MLLINKKEIEFVKFADMHVMLVPEKPITVLNVLMLPEKLLLFVDVNKDTMKY